MQREHMMRCFNWRRHQLNSMPEDQILLTTLGHRSRYQKGMGYGVEVLRRTKSWSTAQQDSQINEKFSETESKLDSANEKINTLTTQVEEQGEKNKSYEEKSDALQAQMQQMTQLMMEMQRNGTST